MNPTLMARLKLVLLQKKMTEEISKKNIFDIVAIDDRWMNKYWKIGDKIWICVC